MEDKESGPSLSAYFAIMFILIVALGIVIWLTFKVNVWGVSLLLEAVTA